MQVDATETVCVSCRAAALQENVGDRRIQGCRELKGVFPTGIYHRMYCHPQSQLKQFCSEFWGSFSTAEIHDPHVCVQDFISFSSLWGH